MAWDRGRLSRWKSALARPVKAALPQLIFKPDQ
jgi:hypothetical protein